MIDWDPVSRTKKTDSKSHIAVLPVIVGLVAQRQLAVGRNVRIGVVGIAKAPVILHLLAVRGAASLHRLGQHGAGESASGAAIGWPAVNAASLLVVQLLLLLLVQQHGQVVLLLLRVVLE